MCLPNIINPSAVTGGCSICYIILSTHVSGIANTAISLSGVINILNSSESNSIYFSANALAILIPTLELVNLL